MSHLPVTPMYDRVEAWADALVVLLVPESRRLEVLEPDCIRREAILNKASYILLRLHCVVTDLCRSDKGIPRRRTLATSPQDLPSVEALR